MAARRWSGLLTFALLLLVAEQRPLGAQTTYLFAGTFDELFSNGGKVTPIFTRPDAPALPTSIDVSPPSNAAQACGRSRRTKRARKRSREAAYRASPDGQLSGAVPE